MEKGGRSGAGRFRAALPWIGLGVGLLAATAPVWRLPLLGFNPTLDELLRMRCFGSSPPPLARPQQQTEPAAVPG